MVLGELYLPLSLRGDERNIGGHQKRKMYWELLEQEKKYSCPQYNSFIEIGEVLGNCYRFSNFCMPQLRQDSYTFFSHASKTLSG